jgi:HTH-type transcriptional regulator, quorum sensing regulator NprR
MENYQLAEIIATNISNRNILAICRQNIGKLYSILKKSDKAIDTYLSSYELYKNSSTLKKVIPISSLMKEYYKKGDLFNAEKWLKKGLDLSNHLNPLESIYAYEFEVYTHLIKGFGNSFEDLMIKKVIPFLDERELYYERFIYLGILADYYFNNRKYKLAANYYNCASKTLTNMSIE